MTLGADVITAKCICGEILTLRFEAKPDGPWRDFQMRVAYGLAGAFVSPNGDVLVTSEDGIVAACRASRTP